MAELGESFDVQSLPDGKSFDVLPAAEYPLVIVNSEVKKTQDGSGRYLKLEFQVVRGEHQNRKLWENLNLWNANQQTVQIAKSQLKQIGQAVGVPVISDSQQLHGKVFLGKVTIKDGGDYGKQNRIVAYKPMPAAVAPQPAQQPAPQPVAAGGSPW